VVAPVPAAHAKAGRLAKHDFRIDPAAGTVTCPASEVTAIRVEPSGARRARFTKATCDRCALRERCVQPVRGAKTIALAPDEELLIAARHALDDPVLAEHLRRTRPRVERLLGLLTHRYGARKSRYIGTRKARLQAAWTAALVNLNPIGRHLTARAA
jgi:Transposase DDE domain